MIAAAIAVLALALSSCAQVITLDRQDRQDTIYIVRGEAAALEAFDREVGANWTGGTVIDSDPSDETLSYWAYTDRTASEARALMMPAILGGLQLDPTAYSEAKQFPSERYKLDQLAATCGARLDPFFITPRRSVEIQLPDNADAKFAKCLTEGVTRVGLSITTPRQDEEKK